jgi:hypothetical protein
MITFLSTIIAGRNRTPREATSMPAQPILENLPSALDCRTKTKDKIPRRTLMP